jgi:hypothetical protein
VVVEEREKHRKESSADGRRRCCLRVFWENLRYDLFLSCFSDTIWILLWIFSRFWFVNYEFRSSRALNF